MTPSDDSLNRAEPETQRDYEVGYGRPPAQHRFKKGKSGNPGGKRKVKPSKETVPRLPTGSFHEMLMLETDRMVRVKAGGRMVEIPAIQASIRALAIRAAKGDRLAAVTLAQLRIRSDAEASAAARPARHAHDAAFPDIAAVLQAGYDEACRTPEENAIAAAEEYQAIWTKVLAQLPKPSADAVAPTPHPDDVTIGRVRGTVAWPGGQPGETLSLDGLVALYAWMRAVLPTSRAAIEAMAEGYAKAVEWERWFATEDVCEVIERHLPQRYAHRIVPDTRSASEMMRDRTLRVMAADERKRLEALDPIGTAVSVPALDMESGNAPPA